MALIDVVAREIHAKVVYYGPALGGKTTTLHAIAGLATGLSVRPVQSIAADDERTLFLDDLPLQLSDVGGWQVLLNLVSVPGQPRFAHTRRALLSGVDGIVFVAGSGPDQAWANVASMVELRQHLSVGGSPSGPPPLVFQYNKRDLIEAVSVSLLDAALNPDHLPVFETVATDGAGVIEPLRAVSKLIASKL